MPQNSISIDSSIIGWLLATGGSLIVFLLGLGFKDVRRKLDKVDNIQMDLERLRSQMERGFVEVNASIRMIELRVEDDDRES